MAEETQLESSTDLINIDEIIQQSEDAAGAAVTDPTAAKCFKKFPKNFKILFAF